MIVSSRSLKTIGRPELGPGSTEGGLTALPDPLAREEGRQAPLPRTGKGEDETEGRICTTLYHERLPKGEVADVFWKGARCTSSPIMPPPHFHLPSIATVTK